MVITSIDSDTIIIPFEKESEPPEKESKSSDKRRHLKRDPAVDSMPLKKLAEFLVQLYLDGHEGDEIRSVYGQDQHRFQSELSHEERAKIMADLYLEQGYTYEAVGAAFGVVRQRVFQILKSYDPSISKERKRRNVKAAASKIKPPEKRECVVCYRKFTPGKDGRRSSVVTCSLPCANAWSRARNLLDPVWSERHRFSVALTVLTNRDNYSPNRIAWASNVRKGLLEGRSISPPKNLLNTHTSSFRLVVEALGDEEQAERRVKDTFFERAYMYKDGSWRDVCAEQIEALKGIAVD